MTATIAGGIAAYLSTNIDGLILLVGLLATPRNRPKCILMAQCYSMTILVAVSLLCSCATVLLPSYLLGSLGLIPLALGAVRLKQTLAGQGQSPTDGANSIPGIGCLSATLILAASGGDNIAVYVSLFAGQSVTDRAITVIVFAVMTPLSFLLARLLMDRPQIEWATQWLGARVTPLLMMGLGIATVVRSGGFELAVTGIGAAL